MVIPIGGGGPGMAMPMMGPPPAELMPRFKKIKACLIVLIISLFVKFLFGLLINWQSIFWIVWSCLNPILNTVIGIFLLKDDLLFGRVHKCLVGTFCASCADQCQGGMSCLCTWFFCNMITALFALLPLPDSDTDMTLIINGFQNLSQPSTWPSNAWVVEYSFFLAATIFALLAQIVGAYQGWMAYRMASEMAPTGGDWGDAGGGGGYGDPYGGYPQAQQRMADPESGGGGGRFGTGGGAPAPGRQSPQAFQPFQGSGQRLGG